MSSATLNTSTRLDVLELGLKLFDGGVVFVRPPTTAIACANFLRTDDKDVPLCRIFLNCPAFTLVVEWWVPNIRTTLQQQPFQTLEPNVFQDLS